MFMFSFFRSRFFRSQKGEVPTAPLAKARRVDSPILSTMTLHQNETTTFPALPTEILILICTRVAAEDPASFFFKVLRLNRQIRHFCLQNRKAILAQLKADYNCDDYHEFISEIAPILYDYFTDKRYSWSDIAWSKGYKFFVQWSVFFSADSVLIASDSGMTDIFLERFKHLSENEAKDLAPFLVFVARAYNLDIWKVILGTGYSLRNMPPAARLYLVYRIGLLDPDKMKLACDFFIENGFRLTISEVKSAIEALPCLASPYHEAASYAPRCRCSETCTDPANLAHEVDFNKRELWVGYTTYFRTLHSRKSEAEINKGLSELFSFLLVKSVELKSTELFQTTIDLYYSEEIIQHHTAKKAAKKALLINSTDFLNRLIAEFDCIDDVEITIKQMYETREEWGIPLVNTILESDVNETDFTRSFLETTIKKQDLATSMLFLLSGAGMTADYLRELRKVALADFPMMVAIIDHMLKQ